MPYSTRSTRKLAKKTRRSVITTFVIIGVLLYATAFWILPAFIGGVGAIKSYFNPSAKPIESIAQNPALSPPTLVIPFEATNNSTIDINGYATTSSKVEIYLDDTLQDTVEVKEDGSFTSKGLSLNLGTNNIYGKTIDSNNKESLPSKTITVVYDNEKPTLDISEPSDGKVIQGGDKKVKVSGKASTDSQVFINDSRVILDPEGKFSTDISVNEGDNTLTIKAQDNAGNSTSLERKVTYQP